MFIRLFETVKLKVARWFNHPMGVATAADPTDTPDLKPHESMEATRLQLGLARGRGAKREAPHRIDEFHPRGAAGRREVHATKGPRKHALPYRGNRTKFPK